MNKFVKRVEIPSGEESDEFGHQDFPLKALPVEVRDYVTEVSSCIGCDPSYLALPVISTLAGAIGNTRRIELKPGWDEPSVIWTAVVGDSGEKKTPPFRQALKPIRTMQNSYCRACDLENESYERARLEYERELSEWKSGKSGEPPLKPATPVARRILVSNTTVEALAPILAENPRGVLLARDELNGWFGSFDKYGSGKGADVSDWLSMHNAEPLYVDRKTGDKRTIIVPAASVSITGCIQPNILSRALSGTNTDNGLAARFLFSWPPRRQYKWTEDSISSEIEERYHAVIRKILELDVKVNDEGELEPVLLPLSPEAKGLWIEYYNKHEDMILAATGPLASAFRKLTATTARLALVIQLVRWASNEAQDTEIDAASMSQAIALSTWFAGEACKVYGILVDSEEEKDQQELVELITRLGGEVSANELRKSTRKFRSNDEAEAALIKLAGKGLVTVQWKKSGPVGGRPRSVFKLNTDDQGECNSQ